MRLPQLDYRKVTIAVLLIAATLFFAYLLYILFFRTFISPPNDQTPIVDDSGTLPGTDGKGPRVIPGISTSTIPVVPGTAPTQKPSPVARGGITKTTTINQTISDNITLTRSGSLQYYDRLEEKFYRIDSRGQATLLTDKAFHNVQQVTWDSVSEKAILEYPDGSNVLYDFTTDKQITLPKHWEEFDFSPNSTQIAGKSIGTTPENNWLFIANADGSGARIIEALGNNANRVAVDWSPNNQVIGTFREDKNFDQQKLFFLGLNQENFKLTLVEGRDIRSMWKPDGTQLVYSAYSSNTGMRPALWIVDAQGDTIGDNRYNLGLNTWADKCTFGASDTLYCAVPDYLPEQAGLYPQLSHDIPDTLYKVNITTGVKSVLAQPEFATSVEQLVVTQDQSTLYFTDQKTGRLHTMKLK